MAIIVVLLLTTKKELRAKAPTTVSRPATATGGNLVKTKASFDRKNVRIISAERREGQ
jgi:hypothetical protein